MDTMSPLEATAVALNALGVWLTVQRMRWCWPVGLVAVALYGWIFHSVRLYADMGLQAVYAALLAYGWWHWRRAPTDDGAVPRIAPLTAVQAAGGLAAGAVAGVGLALLMAHYTDAAAPWLDAPLCTYSLVASLWAARRQAANWLLWIALDAVYAGLYVAKGLPLTAGLYAVFVVMAAIGWRRWQRAWRNQQKPQQHPQSAASLAPVTPFADTSATPSSAPVTL